MTEFVSTKMIIFEVRRWTIHTQHHRFCWDDTLLSKIYGVAKTMKHKTIMQSLKKCMISNALNGTECFVLTEGNESLYSNSWNGDDAAVMTMEFYYQQKLCIALPFYWVSVREFQLKMWLEYLLLKFSI